MGTTQQMIDQLQQLTFEHLALRSSVRYKNAQSFSSALGKLSETCVSVGCFGLALRNYL